MITTSAFHVELLVTSTTASSDLSVSVHERTAATWDDAEPDTTSGCREPRRPIRPTLDGSVTLELPS